MNEDELELYWTKKYLDELKEVIRKGEEDRVQKSKNKVEVMIARKMLEEK